MPKRTNERQQIIELLKAMLASSNCTVTPSKLLQDVVTGVDREVDVVAEYADDGDIFVQSFEVTSKSRPADITWVEQLLKKHENLSTAHLFLVSWSGFTKTAAQLAESNPRLFLVTPEVVSGPSGPEIKTLYTGVVRLTPQKTVFVVEKPSGETVEVVMFADNGLYSSDGTFVGWALQVVHAVLQEPRAIDMVLKFAHNHPNRENLSAFELGADLIGSGLYLRQDTPVEELHALKSASISGDFAFKQEPLDMEIRTFIGQRFAHGKSAHHEAMGLIVAALDAASEVTKVTTNIPLIGGLHQPGPSE
jgi:hypothetical protein